MWSLNIVFSNWFPLVMRSKWELFKPCLPALYLKLIWCSAHVSLLCSDSQGPGECIPPASQCPLASQLTSPLIIRSQELLMTPSHTVTITYSHWHRATVLIAFSTTSLVNWVIIIRMTVYYNVTKPLLGAAQFKVIIKFYDAASPVIASPAIYQPHHSPAVAKTASQARPMLIPWDVRAERFQLQDEI